MPEGTSSPQTPRKTPRCKQCLQPRKGHPRSGCPSAAQRSSDEPHTTVNDASRYRPFDDGVAETSGHRHRRSSLKLPPPNAPHQTFPNPPAPAGSSDLSVLQMPGRLDDRKDPLDQRIERWRRDVPPSTPSDETAPPSPTVKFEEPEMSTPHKHQKKPLLRTMSAEERMLYLEDLKQSTKHTAQVFIMDPEDIPRALEGAQKQGFHGGAHTPAQGQDALLVLGMDKRAVEKLLESVKAEQGSPVRNGIAGAVVGAMAMWTGLAYA